MNRKSSVPKTEIKGNANKYESYREAWARIKQAQEQDFFLEAITIEESIISDRLQSFLSRPDSKNKPKKKAHFSTLIGLWEKEFPKGIEFGDYSNLIESINNWRESRNAAIHAIVKFPPESNQQIDTFLEEAKTVAQEGEKLAREVSNWHKKQKRK